MAEVKQPDSAPLRIFRLANRKPENSPDFIGLHEQNVPLTTSIEMCASSLSGEIVSRLQAVADYGGSWVLQSIDRSVLDDLERAASNDVQLESLEAKVRGKIEGLRCAMDVKNVEAVYNAYAEAKVWRTLTGRGMRVEPIPESNEENERTPDFHVWCGAQSFYVEVKALQTAGGDRGYLRAQEDAYDAQVEIERQLCQGRSVAVGEHVIRPHCHPDREGDYEGNRRSRIARNLTRKARGLIKADQFNRGPTFFALECSLLALSHDKLRTVARHFPGWQIPAAESGVFWHMAFGRDGMPMYKGAEWEGDSNLDVEYEGLGLLVSDENRFVTGMIVLSEEKLVGFVRQADAVSHSTLCSVMDSWNTELNDALMRHEFTPGERAEWHEMVSVKAFELWDGRKQPLWEAEVDWNNARQLLGLPEQFNV